MSVRDPRRALERARRRREAQKARAGVETGPGTTIVYALTYRVGGRAVTSYAFEEATAHQLAAVLGAEVQAVTFGQATSYSRPARTGTHG